VIIDVRTIVNVLGGDITGRDSANVPGPSHSKNDRSLSVIIDRRSGRIVVFSHAGDDWRTCINYVFDRLGLAKYTGACQTTPLVGVNFGTENKKDRTAVALRIWSASSDPVGTIVEKYLREHRGLPISVGLAGNVIRFNPALYLDALTHVPGMVCLFRNIETDEPCGIHRTFLDPGTAQKIDRKMLGVAKAAAIKIDADSSISSRLTIGEGVETLLSARMAGLGPVWSLGSSGGVARFPVLYDLKELSILEENDPTSRRDVRSCARRYRDARKPVNIITVQNGNDFNDAWKAANA
jgi:putative DNA primase/helicase